MNKRILKVTLAPSRLLNKFRKEITLLNQLAHKRHRNFSVKFSKKTKWNLYNTLKVNKFTDNKPFWKRVKPGLTKNTLEDEKMILAEIDKTISEEIDCCDNVSFLFYSIEECLNIKRCEISKEHNDLIVNAIKTFENRLSILKVRQLNTSCEFFLKG